MPLSSYKASHGRGQFWYQAQGMRRETAYQMIGHLRVLVDFDMDDLAIVRGFTPVLSGVLRDAWTATGNVMENLTGYAGFVEFGHKTVSGSWVSGQFFATRAADTLARKYADKLGQYIKNNVEKIFSKGEMTIHFKVGG